jgi:hypothetical protein
MSAQQVQQLLSTLQSLRDAASRHLLDVSPPDATAAELQSATQALTAALGNIHAPKLPDILQEQADALWQGGCKLWVRVSPLMQPLQLKVLLLAPPPAAAAEGRQAAKTRQSFMSRSCNLTPHSCAPYNMVPPLGTLTTCPLHLAGQQAVHGRTTWRSTLWHFHTSSALTLPSLRVPIPNPLTRTCASKPTTAAYVSRSPLLPRLWPSCGSWWPRPLPCWRMSS